MARAEGRSSEHDDLPSTRGRTWRPIVRWLGVALVIGCVVWTARRVDGAGVARALASANLALLALASVASLAMQVGKTLFWGTMVAPVARVPWPRVFRYTIVAAAASAIAPARAGDFARLWMFKRHGVSMRTTGAIVGWEKVSDFLALLLIVAPLPWLLPSLPKPALSALRALSLAPLFVIVAAVAVHRSARVRAWMKMPEGMAGAMLLALVPNALAWLADLGAIALVSRSLGLGGSFATCALVLLGVNVAILVPATPANAGTLELGAIVALGVAGVSTERATAFALLYHVMQLAPVVAIGLALGRGVLGRPRSIAPAASPAKESVPRRDPGGDVDLVLRGARTSNAG